ncbi:MAG: Flp pilus assembly complex ATPase component TadA [Candidatus Marsarchaeota archaeon]|jgi:flagellar protein FlaI|nr:Flp pilus assembly complex ATPase component TadA [Candidatus Marsarchaeota archaeon]
MADYNHQDIKDLEEEILNRMGGRFVNVVDPKKRLSIVTSVAKTINPAISEEEIKEIEKDMSNFSPIEELLADQSIEDIMINNTDNIFVYDTEKGAKMLDIKMDKKELDKFVGKLKLYATSSTSKGNIMDIHLPTKSRVNVVSSPRGYDVTIRNFKNRPMSMIDLINTGELDYDIAARLWLYVDGFRIRPANLLIGGMPAAGKTTLLNAFFSFFRPDTRIITLEDTYEIDISTQDNCVALETNDDLTMKDLVKNVLRMRPDMIIIGEVRGEEANDMMTAMNIGKIVIGTIHASSSRDIVNRLQHQPMNVPPDIIPLIDAIVVLSNLYENKKPVRKVVQISEIAGMESQILLSDLYKIDYKTHKASQSIQNSVTYRDTVARLLGISPTDIIAEERIRAMILEKLNKLGRRDIRSINEIVRDYYDNPDMTLKRLGINNMSPAINV